MNRIPRIARAFEDTQEFRVPFDSNAFSSAYLNAVGAIHDGADLVLIMGLPGSGKSLLLRSVRDAVVRSGGMALCRSRPEGNLDETLEWLLGQLRVTPGSTLRENRLQALAAFLDRQAAPVVLLVDDVDNSPDRAIVGIAALAIFRRDEGHKLQVVLASGAAIDMRLQRADLAWVADHVGARIHLDPLGAKEIGPYIAHRVVAARRWLRGRAVDALAPEVIDRVGLYSAGVPRLVNLLCRTAMNGSRTIIDVAQIDRAARECGLAGPSPAGTADTPAAAMPTPARPAVGSWILMQLRERRAAALRASYACAAALVLALGGAALYKAPPDFAARASVLQESALDAAERLFSSARAVPRQLEAFAETVRQASRGRPAEPPVRVAMADLPPSGSLASQDGWLVSGRLDAGADSGPHRSQRSEPRTGNAGGVSLALSADPAVAVPDSVIDVPATRDDLIEPNGLTPDQAAATEAPAPGLPADSPASLEPVEQAHVDMALVSTIAEEETPVVDAPISDPVSPESASGAPAAGESGQARGEIDEPIDQTTDDTGTSDGPPPVKASGSGTEAVPLLPVTVASSDDAASRMALEPRVEDTEDAAQAALPSPHVEHASAAATEIIEPPLPTLDVAADDPAIRPTDPEPPEIGQPAAVPAPSTTPALAVELLMMRGDEMLRGGDPASARLFFERAAAQGHAGAMASVARTYDPIELRRLRLISFNGQPRQAVEWYRRAIEAGDRTSVEQLAALEQWMSGRS
jgi:type II secretory pathway predicted ATPase ExeA